LFSRKKPVETVPTGSDFIGFQKPDGPLPQRAAADRLNGSEPNMIPDPARHANRASDSAHRRSPVPLFEMAERSAPTGPACAR